MGRRDVIVSRQNLDKGVSEREKVKTGQSVFILEKYWSSHTSGRDLLSPRLCDDTLEFFLRSHLGE